MVSGLFVNLSSSAATQMKVVAGNRGAAHGLDAVQRGVPGSRLQVPNRSCCRLRFNVCMYICNIYI